MGLMDDKDWRILHEVKEAYLKPEQERRARLLFEKDLRAGRDILCYSKDNNSVLIKEYFI